jgi:hypothetical protein
VDTSDTSAARGRIRYRIVVGGRVAADWAGWFEANTLAPQGDDTVLEIDVADQAELHGRLRRIHDLHLSLISVTRIGAPAEADPRSSHSNHPGSIRSRSHE